MAFAFNIVKSRTVQQYSPTYYFNKSIDRYFISGIYVGMDDHLFNCIYINGDGFSYAAESNNRGGGTIGCSANNFFINSNEFYDHTCTLYAVIIYPAIYGDVTIS